MEQHKVMIFQKSIVEIFAGIFVGNIGNILGNIFRDEFPLNILCHSSSLDMTSILIENLLQSGIRS